MTQSLTTSVPGIFSALFGLIQQAAADFDPTVLVAAFELGLDQPGKFVMVHEIVGPEYQWADIGAFSQNEIYEIRGCVSVFTGSSVTDRPTVAVDVLNDTFDLFQAAVMTPVMTNRNMPILGTTGPTPFVMLPSRMKYSAGPGTIGTGSAGWVGYYEWAFRFEARLTPA